MGCVTSKQTGLEAAGPRPQFHATYQITRKLGAGNAAQVYEARNVKTGFNYAVKITDLRKYSKKALPNETDPQKEQMAEREAFLLGKLGENPHIVRLKAAYTETIFSYIVLEQCEMVLFEALESLQEFNEKILGGFFCQMRQALEVIHKAKIVHCDIKPDNFLCTNDGIVHTVKLCDFGFSKLMPFAGSLQDICGNAAFRSPEMLKSVGYGPKTDVWSLGVMAYLFLYGQFPYGPMESVKKAIVEGSPAPSFRVDGAVTRDSPVSKPTEETVRMLLDRDPKSRPSAQSAGKLPWFNQQKNGKEQVNYQSLRPMLYNAKHMGGFEIRSKHTKTWKGTIDATIAKLQAESHGSSSLDTGDDWKLWRIGSSASSSSSGSCSSTSVQSVMSRKSTRSCRPSTTANI